MAESISHHNAHRKRNALGSADDLSQDALAKAVDTLEVIRANMRIISRAPGAAVRCEGLGARPLVFVMSRASRVLHESSPQSARIPVQSGLGAQIKYVLVFLVSPDHDPTDRKPLLEVIGGGGTVRFPASAFYEVSVQPTAWLPEQVAASGGDRSVAHSRRTNSGMLSRRSTTTSV